MFDLASYILAQERYQGARDAAYHATWDVWSQRVGPDLKLWSIDSDALEFYRRIWCPAAGAAHPDGEYFRWSDIYEHIRTTPRRFDMAIWKGSNLLGLAAGQASGGNDNVTLKFIERWFDDLNPLRGQAAAITVEGADNYAKLLGKQYVKVKNPAPAALSNYINLGFSLAERIDGNTYYARKVE